MKKKAIIVFIFILSCSVGYSQTGGTNTYDFLNLTNSARVASLGGNVTAIQDNDLSFVYHNPALLSSEMDGNIVLNYINYFAGVNYGYVSYAKSTNKYGNIGAGLHYVNYGKFIEADETGLITGEFSAVEYCQNIYWSKKIDTFLTIGATFKIIYSELGGYYSSGLALDAGITYHNPDLLTASLVFKNAGTQLKPFTAGNYEPLPFDIQMGISKKLAHAPFRVMLQTQYLYKYDLTYVDPDKTEKSRDPITGELPEESQFRSIADNLGKHLNIGVELLPMKHFYIRLGYNYKRRSELKIDTRSYLTGMSLGVGLRIYKFHFSYGRAQYHLAGASNHLSMTVNLNDFYKKSAVAAIQ